MNRGVGGVGRGQDQDKFHFLPHFPGAPSYKNCSAGRKVGGDLSQSFILQKRQLKTKEGNGFLNKVTQILEELRYNLRVHDSRSNVLDHE